MKVFRFFSGINSDFFVIADSIKLTIVGDKDSAARFNTVVSESIAIEYSDSEDVIFFCLHQRS